VRERLHSYKALPHNDEQEIPLEESTEDDILLAHVTQKPDRFTTPRKKPAKCKESSRPEVETIPMVSVNPFGSKLQEGP
jgi:hypothetical protein